MKYRFVISLLAVSSQKKTQIKILDDLGVINLYPFTDLFPLIIIPNTILIENCKYINKKNKFPLFLVDKFRRLGFCFLFFPMVSLYIFTSCHWRNRKSDYLLACQILTFSWLSNLRKITGYSSIGIKAFLEHILCHFDCYCEHTSLCNYRFFSQFKKTEYWVLVCRSY